MHIDDPEGSNQRLKDSVSAEIVLHIVFFWVLYMCVNTPWFNDYSALSSSVVDGDVTRARKHLTSGSILKTCAEK